MEKRMRSLWYDKNANLLDEDIWGNDRCVDMCEGDE